MKQFVKKKVSFVMVMIMAVITVISMSLPMAVFAQGGGYTLTLKNEGSTPHTFQIYQIFSGDLDESKTLSNIQWGTGIKEASKETLGTAAEKAQTLTGESEAKEFAKTIQEHLNEDNKLEVRVEKNDSTTVANLNAGYYLIKDKEGSQTQTPPNSAYTSYILKVVGNTTAKTKLDVPELVKKVQENSKKDIEGNGWQDAADYNIDEVIPYKLTEELHGVSNQARTSLIRCVLQYINLKIYDNIKVTELAKQFYLSESALRSRFKEEIGVPINEYVNKRKIEESKMMIWSGIPAGEIARRLSFYDLSHYYRTFKKYTGVTPQQFRDTNIIGQEM